MKINVSPFLCQYNHFIHSIEDFDKYWKKTLANYRLNRHSQLIKKKKPINLYQNHQITRRTNIMLISSSEITGIKHDYCIWNDRFHADTATQWHVPWNRLNMADGDNNPEIVISANEIPITYSQRPLCNVYKQIPRGFRVFAAWISAGDGLPRARGSSRSKNRPFQELPAYLLTPDSICSVQTMSRPRFSSVRL